MEVQKNPKKETTPLITENPVFIEKKKEVENYLNRNSKPIFIIMIVLIALSILLSIFLSLTRKPREFEPERTSLQLPNVQSEIQKFNALHSQYKNLREEEERIDSLIQNYKENEN